MADVEPPQPDSAAAVAFLRLFEPEGPWVLTAIAPDRRTAAPSTATFWPADEAALTRWLDQHNGRRNIYFSVNRPLRALNKKAERTDIGEVRWLHVDIDPRAGEDLAEERARALCLLTDVLPAGVPAPTAVIFSGGGYQGFWRLETPIPIGGDLARAEDAKRYNQALERAFGADNCHNVDRIMRLPGTINLPDERKARKGRVPTLATLHRFDPANTYPLARFTPAPAARAIVDGGHGASAPEEAERLADVRDLDCWGVPDRVKVIIVQGRDPDNPKDGDDSRSAWLFDAVCQLVRCDVPDSVIMAILTDPDLGISASVLDKGRGAERYAFRQIEQARDHVADPLLAELNERHFVVENDSGKCRVAEWVPADNGREQLSFQSFDDFRNRYMNRQVEVGTDAKGAPITKPLGGWWLAHARRRQFRGLVFRPGGDPVIDGRLNLWRGFGVDPVPGDWSLMRAHIREVLAAGDPVCDDYILRWAAWAVQHPDEPAEVALVFRGGMGTGKSTFGRAMRRLFGQHGLHVNSPTQVSGRFNAHLRDVCLLFADEAIQPGDRAARGVLKAMLTEPTLPIEGKGRDVIEAPNYTKVVMASNEDWVAAVDDDDRRFAVFDVSKDRQRDEAYFAALYAELDGGGLAAMLHDLLAMDLEGWHPRRAIPDTTARQEQRAATLDGFDAFFLDLLREGTIPAHSWPGVDQPRVSTAALRELAAERNRRTDITFNQVSDLLGRLGFRKDRRSRPSGFVLPTLPEARAAWDRVRSPVAWDDADRWVAMGDAAGPGGPF